MRNHLRCKILRWHQKTLMRHIKVVISAKESTVNKISKLKDGITIGFPFCFRVQDDMAWICTNSYTQVQVHSLCSWVHITQSQAIDTFSLFSLKHNYYIKLQLLSIHLETPFFLLPPQMPQKCSFCCALYVFFFFFFLTFART